MLYIEKKMEKGRSMIEMLGVLAVIGLLSIVGLSFYRAAITKHKAVEVYGAVGIAGAQMFIKQNPGTKNISDVTVTTKGVPGAGNNAIIRVDFGDDTDLCKEVKALYDNSTEYKFIGDCT